MSHQEEAVVAAAAAEERKGHIRTAEEHGDEERGLLHPHTLVCPLCALRRGPCHDVKTLMD